jgi:hypothetical protein
MIRKFVEVWRDDERERFEAKWKWRKEYALVAKNVACAADDTVCKRLKVSKYRFKFVRLRSKVEAFAARLLANAPVRDVERHELDVKRKRLNLLHCAFVMCREGQARWIARQHFQSLSPLAFRLPDVVLRRIFKFLH